MCIRDYDSFSHDLLEDRRFSVCYYINIFHVAVRVLSNRTTRCD